MDAKRLVGAVRSGPGTTKRISRLSDGLRMLVFLEIVQAQDEGTSVAKSRVRMMEKYGITMEQVMEIESEGRAKTWAPL